MKCDAKAFSKLYEQVYQDLYRYALCLMRDPHEAEDAVSAAVLSAYEHIHKLRKEEAFKSWIFTILSNICKKRLKQVAKEGIQQTEDFFPEGQVEGRRCGTCDGCEKCIFYSFRRRANDSRAVSVWRL